MSKNERNEKPVSVHADAAAPQSGEEFAPLVDIYETDDGTTMLVAEMPGASEEAVDIRVEKGVLTLSAEAHLPQLGDEYSRTYAGFVGGRYFRAFALSDEVDREKISASMTDGVLTLTLPKAAAARTHKIKVKTR